VRRAAKKLIKSWRAIVEAASDEEKEHEAIVLATILPPIQQAVPVIRQRVPKRPASTQLSATATSAHLDPTAKFESQALRRRHNKVVQRPVEGCPTTLFGLCIETLQKHIAYLGDVGDVPLNLLMPVLQTATPTSLARLEQENPGFAAHTQHLWEKVSLYQSWVNSYVNQSLMHVAAREKAVADHVRSPA